jgi:D-cysteine desulfhydrase/L-cysteate sulfo-lyase
VAINALQPKVDLVLLPTPLHRLDRLSKELGIDLWIKRDDLTGFAFGGNKGRKLEYLIHSALASGADTVVTCGSAQSNFIRQLTAACAKSNLNCAAVVMQLPYEHEPAQGAMRPEGANLLLNQLVNADIRVIPNGVWDVLMAASTDLANEYRAKGHNVFEIPIGGSSPLGAYAFFLAGKELMEQDSGFDCVISASSSGSTQTGLTYAFTGTTTRYHGISCDPEPELVDEFVELARALDEMTGHNHALTHKDFVFDLRFVGPGYGVPSQGSIDAIKELAQKEGIFLDPVYTGKAFDGLLKMARSGELTGKVCFWHTGGTPTLFAMPEGLI